MANKQLTAKVKLNISDVESKIKRLNTLFNQINKLSSKQSGLDSAAVKQADQIKRKTQETVTNHHRLVDVLQQVLRKKREESKKEDEIKTKRERTLKLLQQQSSVLSSASNALRGQSGIFDSIWQKVKQIAATWLTITGVKNAINVSDKIVSSKNRLNSLNDGDIKATELQMDKMYASANRARMSYQDMMSNVSKSMTLAGDAFHGNIDNAIRFQEIMGKAYVVGGASATEASTSMYQLIQALGGGSLAGDELRSVREGAPLAYKEIEKFAQKTLGASDSLKDLAADGLITSELVVAAVMDMGSSIDETFGGMSWTFTQAWERIKNMAIQAFQPVSYLLEQLLNKAIKSGAFEKLESTFTKVSEAMQIALMGIAKAVTWVIDNFNWLKWVVIGVFTTMIAKSILAGVFGAAAAIMQAVQWWINAQAITVCNVGLGTMLLIISVIIIAIVALIAVFILWKIGVIDACQAIVAALFIVGIAVLIIGIMIGALPTILIGALLIMLAVAFMFFELFVGLICGIGYWFGAIFQNIGIWWSNLINGLKAGFWNWMADLCEGFDWLLKAINAVAGIFGFGTITVGGLRAKASGYEAQKQDYISLSGAWNEGYGKGSSWAGGVKDSINQWGSNYQNWNLGDLGNLSGNLGKSLGLNTTPVTFPGVNDPATDVANAYNPDLDKINGNLGGINDNTTDMADSMKSTEEDLSYLRKIAEMEWKKEYTTAEIKIDMTNNNNISKEVDGEGIITLLSQRLVEEMDSLANGVYVS